MNSTFLLAKQFAKLLSVANTVIHAFVHLALKMQPAIIAFDSSITIHHTCMNSYETVASLQYKLLLGYDITSQHSCGVECGN